MAEQHDEVMDLLALMGEQSLSGDCANCGNNDWIGLEEPVALRGETKKFPTLVLACKTCGYLRLHLISVLKGQA